MSSVPVGTSSPFDAVRPLDPETLRLFAVKGLQTHAADQAKPLATNGNAVRVRRVLQLTCDLARRPINELRILDHACGDGVFSIEAALRGAQVVGTDARSERLDAGAAAARRLGLDNVRFEQLDVRAVNRQTHGSFDVIYFLGILYHLDVPDVFDVVETLHDMCGQFVIIDTEIALHPATGVQHRGRTYYGFFGEEHDAEDPPDVRRGRVKASIDNHRSFVFTQASLVRLLVDAGFSTVNLCLAPLEPDKTPHRITLVAHKGDRAKLCTYPWVNDKTEDDIATAMGVSGPAEAVPVHRPPSFAGRLRGGANVLLRRFGLELRRAKS